MADNTPSKERCRFTHKTDWFAEMELISMKKKKLIPVVLVCALVVALCVPQVNAFAMDALSNFRVEQAKTITITMDDISQMSAYVQELKNGEIPEGFDHEDFGPEGFDLEDHNRAQLEDKDIPQPAKLDSIADFAAFSVKLPKSFEEQTAQLYASENIEKTVSMPDGSDVTFALSPTLVAKYDNAVFAATKGMSDTLSPEQKADMKEKLLALPFLTENIRTQLAEIDPQTKDIYLPVVPGISREATINGTTGYLYGMNELRGVAGALPEEFLQALNDADTEEYENMNLLIWTKDGVLYMLGGDMPEAELTAAARSV